MNLNEDLVKMCEIGQIEVVKLLIENGADVNARSNDGETALMIASRIRDEEIKNKIITCLVENGATIEAR